VTTNKLIPAVEQLAALSSAIAPAIFQQAVEQADLAISITDAEANIVYANPAFSRATGYSQEELQGCNQSLLSNKSTPAQVYDEMWAMISRGLPWSGRLINRRKDGSKYLADLLITPVANVDGEIGSYLGIHRDVTHLHWLECEVADQKAMIESVVDSMPVVTALLDSQDKVVMDNHEYKKLMGDLRMAEPASLILDAVRADLGDCRAAAQDGRYAFNDHEIRIDSPAGPRWFSCSGIWVQRKDGTADAFFTRGNELYLLLLAKETTRQRAEQEKTRLALLQAMMAEEYHIEDLRETLSAAVFKIEGPINIMASVMATLERRGNGPAGSVLMEALHAGKEAIESLRSAIPEHRPESQTIVNLNEALRDVLDLTTTRMLAAGISVHWQPQAVMPSVNAYPTRVRSMFKALVENAIDAMRIPARASPSICG
jgi:nitrogen fixation negative regulator NifL